MDQSMEPPPAGPATPGASPLPDHADVITKPPLLYLAGILLGLWLDPRVPLPFPIATPGCVWLGGGIAALAVALLIWGVVTFRLAAERLDPHTPTDRILTGGPFRWSRNPLYLALTLLTAGIGIALANLWILVLLVPVVAVMVWGVIRREERYLERKFGDEYRKYQRSVRRWI